VSTVAIRTERLTREFKTVRALNALSIEVPRGIIYGFLGPNGAGKTTTINLLLGLLEPTSGSAEVLGFDTKAHPQAVRSRTGALLEHNGLYEQMTAADNLEYYGRIYRMPLEDRQVRIKQLLDEIGLWDRREEKVGSWSKGMKQKLAVARAIFHRPQLIFLDEPTAGLDVVSANALRADLAALVETEGVTVFLTTHNMAEAEKLCSKVAVIREGSLIAVGHPDELRGKAGGPRVEIHGDGFTERALSLLQSRPEVTLAQLENGHIDVDLKTDAEVSPLVELLVKEGVRVEEVRKGSASMEEVFLTLMEESDDR
jgi:ABC-2 type transport system ATP-binding protein